MTHLQSVARFTSIRIVSIVGGLSAQKQERQLSQHPQVIVATPGRLHELMQSGQHDALRRWETLRFLVLDEADRMVAQGHYAELGSILDALQRRRVRVREEEGGRVEKLQHFFFSATLTLGELGRERIGKGRQRQPKREADGAAGSDSRAEEQSAMVSHLVSLCGLSARPHVVDLTRRQRVVLSLQEHSLPCATEDKDFCLYALLLQHQPPAKAIVFVNAISCLRRLSSLLSLLHLPVFPLHAEMQQRQRLKNLDRFTSAPSSSPALLISTDVAARGLDIPAVPLIVHYQLPLSAEVYIHRCGRTARAGREGVSVAMVAEGDVKAWRRVQTVIRGGEEAPRWELDSRLLDASRARLLVARKLDRIVNRQRQAASKADWFQKKAQELDIELDDDVTDSRGRGGLGKRRGGQQEEAEGALGRREQEEVQRLQRELDSLLSKPVQDERRHARFFTLNVVEEMQKREEAEQQRRQQAEREEERLRKQKQKQRPAATATKAAVLQPSQQAKVKNRAVKAQEQQEVKEAALEQSRAGELASRMEEEKVKEEEPVAGAGGASDGQPLGKRAKKNRRKQRQKQLKAEAETAAAAVSQSMGHELRLSQL